MARRLLRNSALATGGVLVQGLARFGYTILIGRSQGADTLGSVSSMLSLAVFVSLFWPTGAAVAASRYIASDLAHGAARSVSAPVLARAFLLSLPLLAVGTFFVAMAISADAATAGATTALMLAFSAYTFTRGAALGSSSFVRIAVMDTVSSVLALTALALVLLADWNWALLLPLTLGYALFALLVWPRIGTRGPTANRAHTRFIALNSVAQVATGGLLQVAMLAAVTFGTARQAGLFAAALALATPASMIGLSINQVLVPHFAAMNARGEAAALAAATRRLTLAVSGGLGVIFGILSLAAPFVLSVFYGRSYGAAAPYMQILILGVCVYSVSLIPTARILATGRELQFTVVSSAGFFVGVALMICLGPLTGIWSAPVGYACGALLAAIITIALGIRNPRSTPSPGSEGGEP